MKMEQGRARTPLRAVVAKQEMLRARRGLRAYPLADILGSAFASVFSVPSVALPGQVRAAHGRRCPLLL
jgi:hypothetical protein